MSDNASQPMPWWVTLLLGAMVCCTLAIVATVAGVVWWLSRPGGPVPQPTPSRLAELVPDTEARAQLSAFYGDFAAVLASDSKPLKTTGQFRAAYRVAVPVMQQAGRLPTVKAIDEPISNQLRAAIGVADTPIDGDPPLRSNLAATLQAISDDFGGR